MLQEGPEPAAKVVDLMEALNASIAAAAGAGTGAKGAKRAPPSGCKERTPAEWAAPLREVAKTAKQPARPKTAARRKASWTGRDRPAGIGRSSCDRSLRRSPDSAHESRVQALICSFSRSEAVNHGHIPLPSHARKGSRVTTAQVRVPEARIPEWMAFDGLVQLISVDGQRTVGCPYWELVSDVDAAQLRDLYRDMAVVRRIDAEAVALQRQGELGAVGPAPRAGGRAGRVGPGAAPRRLRLSELPRARRRVLPRVDPVAMLRLWRGTGLSGWEPAAFGIATPGHRGRRAGAARHRLRLGHHARRRHVGGRGLLRGRRDQRG